MNVWRRPVTNVATRQGSSFKTVIRRARAGWAWFLMIESEVVAQGLCASQVACRDAARAAKAEL